MSNTTNNNEPIARVKDGKLTIAIWKNASGEGNVFYSISATQRREKDDAGEYANYTSLSGTQILQGKRLMGMAYDRIRELEQADYEASKPRTA